MCVTIGKLIPKDIHEELRSKFAYLDHDIDGKKRLFFDNSGGSLRLKSSVLVKNEIDLLPDCPERNHERALMLQDLMQIGTSNILEIMLNARSGSLLTELTASQVMYQIVATILQGTPKGNVITTNIEHPSAYDSIEFYCHKTDKEMRIVKANSSGFIEPADVVAQMDENTILISVIASSNISGNIMDLESIVKLARQKKPDVFIISDAVQHLPHGTIDLQKISLDGLNFAPYKFMATRGIGFGYVSDRVSALPHHKLIAREDSVWSLGTPTASLFLSMSQVIEYVMWLGRAIDASLEDGRESFLAGMKAIEFHERALLIRLLEGTDEILGLRHLPKVNVYLDSAPLEDRDLIIAMGIDGWEFNALRAEYHHHNITVYERVNTSIYSKRIVEALGLQGAIRVSPLHCHTLEEIDTFLKVTQKISELRS